MSHEKIFEIERKFLVDTVEFNKIKSSLKYEEILQGKILRKGGTSVRARIKNGTGYITLKHDVSALRREEYESEVSSQLARELLKTFGEYTVTKIRYYYPVGNYTWEIDEYTGLNEGLTIAEIELRSENDIINVEKPSFIMEEVSEEQKYRNSELAKNPYTKWKKNKKTSK